jgi:multisubunit Na+/H+ antiporter MnhC subunit
MHQVSKILFCHETLHVSGIYCAHHQQLSAVHVAIGMFRAGWNLTLLGSGHITCTKQTSCHVYS